MNLYERFTKYGSEVAVKGSKYSKIITLLPRYVFFILNMRRKRLKFQIFPDCWHDQQKDLSTCTVCKPPVGVCTVPHGMIMERSRTRKKLKRCPCHQDLKLRNSTPHESLNVKFRDSSVEIKYKFYKSKKLPIIYMVFIPLKIPLLDKLIFNSYFELHLKKQRCEPNRLSFTESIGAQNTTPI